MAESLLEELFRIVESVGGTVTFSANCLSGMVGEECRCWRCLKERGQPHDEATEAHAAREAMFFRKGEAWGKSQVAWANKVIAESEATTDPCEWNPTAKRAALADEAPHARATTIAGANGRYRLCDWCAGLPEFKRLKKKKIVVAK